MRSDGCPAASAVASAIAFESLISDARASTYQASNRAKGSSVMPRGFTITPHVSRETERLRAPGIESASQRRSAFHGGTRLLAGADQAGARLDPGRDLQRDQIGRADQLQADPRTDRQADPLREGRHRRRPD